MPDFSIRVLLTGEQISDLSGVPPGPQLGLLKKALLEAQVRGDVKTADDAAAFVRRRPVR
jgi:poly(A) polymerase